MKNILKKIAIICVITIMLIGSLGVLFACSNNQGNIGTGYSECGRFSLEIFVEETTLPKGENFIVNIVFRNLTDKDMRIMGGGNLFFPHIPRTVYSNLIHNDGADGFEIQAFGYHKRTHQIGRRITRRGTFNLTYSSTFQIYEEWLLWAYGISAETIHITSTPITLTVTR